MTDPAATLTQFARMIELARSTGLPLLEAELRKADDYRAEREAFYEAKVSRLEQENAVLRARVTALEAFVESFDGPEESVTTDLHRLRCWCPTCGVTEWAEKSFVHKLNCAWVRAQAALSSAPKGEADG